MRISSPCGEGAVLAAGAHTQDLGLGDLFNAPDAVLVHQQLENLPGPALKAAQEVLVAVEEGFGSLVAADQGRVEGQVGQRVAGFPYSPPLLPPVGHTGRSTVIVPKTATLVNLTPATAFAVMLSLPVG